MRGEVGGNLTRGVNMAKRGAKSKYERQVQPYLKEINSKVRQGVTEEAIAHSLGISVASLNNYRNKYKEFAEALSKDKGADVLNELINAGIEAAKGQFKTNKQTIYERNENGELEAVRIVENEVFIPPNASLNQFYVKNFGKDKGFVADPLEYELKKAKAKAEEDLLKAKNWDVDFNDNK